MKYKKYKNCITRTNIYTTQYVAEIHAMQCAKMCNSLWCLVTSCQIYPGIKLRICTALWCLAVGVLSLVAKCVLGISLRCSLMYLFSTTICSAEIHAMQSTCNAKYMQCRDTCNAMQRAKICTALWFPAAGVLSLVAKYAARSVSQPSIHVYPELYVKILHKTHKFFGSTVLFI